MDKISIKNLKSMVDFTKLAIFMGEEEIRQVTEDSVRMRCPFHEGDRTPSFFYNKRFLKCKCFGCDEGNIDVITYIRRRKNLSNFTEAVKFLAAFVGVDDSLIDLSKVQIADSHIRDLSTLKKFTNQSNKEKFEYFTEEDIKRCIETRGDYYLNKPKKEFLGFTKETLDFFEVGFDHRERRVVIPIRNVEGELVGLSGRTIKENYEGENIPKWWHYPKSNISENFFNIHNGIRFTKENKNSIIYITEGMNDVMALHQYGYKNVIACLNNGLTEKQKILLLRYFNTIYLVLDGDTGGERGVKTIYQKIQGYFNIYHVKLPENRDPDEISKETLDSCISSAAKLP